jgi:hypothetical protein
MRRQVRDWEKLLAQGHIFGLGHSSVVELKLSMHEALGSFPNGSLRERERQRDRDRHTVKDCYPKEFMKTCSTPPAIRKLQIKTMRYHYIPCKDSNNAKH